MTRWLLLKPDEDGNPTRWLDAKDLEDVLSGDYGIQQFLAPDGIDLDPNYWPAGSGMLLKVEVVEPKQVASKWAIG